MSKQYLIALLITIGLFYLVFSEYYDHLNAFYKQNTVKVIILDTHCRHRRSNMKVKYDAETEYVDFLRKECRHLKVEDKLLVLRGSTDDLYWNRKPTKRIFWIIPVYVLLIAYMIYWHW